MFPPISSRKMGATEPSTILMPMGMEMAMATRKTTNTINAAITVSLLLRVYRPRLLRRVWMVCSRVVSSRSPKCMMWSTPCWIPRKVPRVKPMSMVLYTVHMGQSIAGDFSPLFTR